MVVAMAVADGKGVCSWFFDCEINYFIVVFILFYCDVYIILLY